MRSREHYEATKKLHEAEGGLAYILDVFGDEIANRESYKGISGMEAVHFYMIHKFGWLPSDVKAMKYEDIRFVLTEEMHEWTVPAEAR